MMRIKLAGMLILWLLFSGGCSQPEPQPAAPRQETGGREETGALGNTAPPADSVEQSTRVHRLASSKRAVYDAFSYVNRIPEEAEEGESPSDIAGRIFGRLANQEGRILLKVPPGMDHDSYRAFKTFFRYEGETSVGNCAACHTLTEFTDEKKHLVTRGGVPVMTPSVRNLGQTTVDVRKAIMTKITASRQKKSGEAEEIDDAYAVMNLSEEDVAGLVAFIELLNDVPDEDFRSLILGATLLDTSGDIE